MTAASAARATSGTCASTTTCRQTSSSRWAPGESDLDLDSLTLTSLDLEMGAGEPKVDLTGDYAQDFDVSIEGGVGETTVLVPSEVGVRVRAEGGLGKINVEGFQREGEAYVNDAYGDSDVSLNVDVRGGVGATNLEVV
jgi:predicted membrane protein